MIENRSRNHGSPGAWSEALAAAEAWWREAGVDGSFSDEPRDWLAREADPAPGEPKTGAPRPASKRTEHAPLPRIGGDPQHWPSDLGAFSEWWLSEPTLTIAGERKRILPRGTAAAALMVLVAEPEAEDSERLLSGPQGRLLAGILAALGLGENHAYMASVLPAHVGLIDWPGLAAGGMGEVLAHHIALARPERLLVFARESVPLLVGQDTAQALPSSVYFAHGPAQVPVACVASLQGVLDRPSRKAHVWKTLLDWGRS